MHYFTVDTYMTYSRYYMRYIIIFFAVLYTVWLYLYIPINTHIIYIYMILFYIDIQIYIYIYMCIYNIEPCLSWRSPIDSFFSKAVGHQPMTKISDQRSWDRSSSAKSWFKLKQIWMDAGIRNHDAEWIHVLEIVQSYPIVCNEMMFLRQVFKLMLAYREMF